MTVPDLTTRLAEVLARHQWYDATSDREDPATGCTGCDDWFGNDDAAHDGTFALHQAAQVAEQLAAVVKEAQAEAWTAGHQAGFEEHKNPGAFVNDYWDSNLPNPYRSNDE